ncbi:MAG: hypothetical protein NZO58_04130, partial [Gemmataceae bacterium]|nr:hypothetical protein [Gemmataceae bacterium]
RDYVDLRVPGLSEPIAPDQLQFLNALFVIILIPTFNFTFAWLDPTMAVFTPMRKILAGFLLTAFAIGIMAAAGFQVYQPPSLGANEPTPPSAKVFVVWPALAYIVLTVGEVLLYGTMLELAYTAAPPTMKSFVTACFLITNAVANLINMVWTPFYGGSLTDPIEHRGPLPPGEFFAITAAAVAAAALLFVVIGRRFEHAQNQQRAAGLA